VEGRPLDVEELPPLTGLIISDYGKGLLTWDILVEIAKKFPQNVIFSPHVTHCLSYRNLSQGERDLFDGWIWVVNESEWNSLPSLTHPKVHYVIETRGHNSVICATPLVRCLVDVRSLAPSHTVAIGDCFLAAFSAAYFAGVEFVPSIGFAIECCRRVLQSDRIGNCRIMPEDLNK